MRYAVLITVLGSLFAVAQVEPRSESGTPGASQTPPRSERNREAGESSSRNTQIDISPPKDDAKNHPFSASAVADAKDEASDILELRPYDPHRAIKNIEVGDFYFKRRNYRAALDRYREALEFKPNDAVATFRLAQCFEKLGEADDAIDHYREYLRILPNGELAEQARKALDSLNKAEHAPVPGKP
jgi:tetratricopeptide (TPR) repeat protein